jgi:hypothetical protein
MGEFCKEHKLGTKNNLLEKIKYITFAGDSTGDHSSRKNFIRTPHSLVGRHVNIQSAEVSETPENGNSGENLNKAHSLGRFESSNQLAQKMLNSSENETA